MYLPVTETGVKGFRGGHLRRRSIREQLAHAASRHAAHKGNERNSGKQGTGTLSFCHAETPLDGCLLLLFRNKKMAEKNYDAGCADNARQKQDKGHGLHIFKAAFQLTVAAVIKCNFYIVYSLCLPQLFIVFHAFAAVGNPKGGGIALHGTVACDIIFIAVFDGSGGNKYFISLRQISPSSFDCTNVHLINTFDRIVTLFKGLVNPAVSRQPPLAAAQIRRDGIVGIAQRQMQRISGLEPVPSGKGGRHQTDLVSLSVVFFRKEFPLRKVSLPVIKCHNQMQILRSRHGKGQMARTAQHAVFTELHPALSLFAVIKARRHLHDPISCQVSGKPSSLRIGLCGIRPFQRHVLISGSGTVFVIIMGKPTLQRHHIGLFRI